MQMLRILIIAVLALRLSIAFGATDENEPLWLQDFHDLQSRSGAIAGAKSIHVECARILDLIPRLSPSEDAWLKGEKDAKRDLEKVMRSREQALLVLYVHFYDCAIQSNLAAKSKTDRERVFAWLLLASRFSLESDLGFYADRVGIPELIQPVKRFAAWERLNTSRIIDDVALPYVSRSK